MKTHALRLLIREILNTESSPKIVDIIGSGLAVVCYTDSDFAGKAVATLASSMGIEVERDSSRNPKGWWTGKVPQGHAFIVLVNPADLGVTRCDFGQYACEYTDLDSTQQKIAVWLAKTGIPFMSSTKVGIKSLGALAKNSTLSNLKDLIVADQNRVMGMTAIKNVDYAKCLAAAGTNGSCRPYNLIPITPEIVTAMRLIPGASSLVPFLKGSDNCGSYVARIVSAGTGANLNLESMKIAPGLIVQGVADSFPNQSIAMVKSVV